MNKGFTLIELLIVIGIIIILFAATIPVYINWQNSAVLNTTAITIKENLELAKARSRSSYNNTSHGVYFSVIASGSDEVIIYQGGSYLNRVPEYDLITELDEALNLTTSLVGNEINFSQGLGQPSTDGSIILTNSNTEKVRSVFINSFGIIDAN